MRDLASIQTDNVRAAARESGYKSLQLLRQIAAGMAGRSEADQFVKSLIAEALGVAEHAAKPVSIAA